MVLPEEQEKVYLIFAMREGDNGSVFHCYYSLTDDTDSASLDGSESRVYTV